MIAELPVDNTFNLCLLPCSWWWIHNHRFSQHQSTVHGWRSGHGKCNGCIPAFPPRNTETSSIPHPWIPNGFVVWTHRDIGQCLLATFKLRVHPPGQQYWWEALGHFSWRWDCELTWPIVDLPSGDCQRWNCVFTSRHAPLSRHHCQHTWDLVWHLACDSHHISVFFLHANELFYAIIACHITESLLFNSCVGFYPQRVQTPKP